MRLSPTFSAAAVAGIAAGSILTIAIGARSESGGTETVSVGHPLWEDSVRTPSELLQKSAVVVLVTPAGDEHRVEVVERGEIWAAPASVVEVFEGDLAPGDVIEVSRFVPNVTDKSDYQPAMTEDVYLVGLVPSSYGDGSWSTVSGPMSMLAFSGRGDEAPVVPLVPGAEPNNFLEEGLGDRTLGQVRAAVQEAVSAQAIE